MKVIGIIATTTVLVSSSTALRLRGEPLTENCACGVCPGEDPTAMRCMAFLPCTKTDFEKECTRRDLVAATRFPPLEPGPVIIQQGGAALLQTDDSEDAIACCGASCPMCEDYTCYRTDKPACPSWQTKQSVVDSGIAPSTHHKALIEALSSTQSSPKTCCCVMTTDYAANQKCMEGCNVAGAINICL